MASKKELEIAPELSLPGQAKKDNDLIENVAAKVRNAYREGGLATMLAVGKIVLDEMFDGNVDRFNAAEKSHVSYAALAKREDTGISASNLWYAVALHENVRLLGNEDAQKLGSSQHRLLTHVKDQKKRAQLAREAIKKDLTVRQLDELIRKRDERDPAAQKLGRPALAPVAKQFNEVERTVDALGDVNPVSVKGLSVEDGNALLVRANATLEALEAWLEALEAELELVEPTETVE